jgi:hypothetical protein
MPESSHGEGGDREVPREEELWRRKEEISSSCVLGNDAGDEAGQQGKMLVTRLETKRETRRARLGTILETRRSWRA